MIHLFTVSASTTDRAAAADATMTLQDDGITVSGLQPGTRSYAITNAALLRDRGWYQAAVTNSGGTSTSAVVFVNVSPSSSQALAA